METSCIRSENGQLKSLERQATMPTSIRFGMRGKQSKRRSDEGKFTICKDRGMVRGGPVLFGLGTRFVGRGMSWER